MASTSTSISTTFLFRTEARPAIANSRAVEAVCPGLRGGDARSDRHAPYCKHTRRSWALVCSDPSHGSTSPSSRVRCQAPGKVPTRDVCSCMPSPHLARTLIVEQARNRQGCAARKVTGTTASTDIRSVQPIPRESPRTTSTRGLARGDSVPLPCGGVIPPAIAVDGDRIPGGVSVAEGAIKDGGNCGADRSVLPLAAAWPSLRPWYHGRWTLLSTKTLFCARLVAMDMHLLHDVSAILTPTFRRCLRKCPLSGIWCQAATAWKRSVQGPDREAGPGGIRRRRLNCQWRGGRVRAIRLGQAHLSALVYRMP